MAYGLPTLTIVGNLADNPEIRTSPGGRSITKARVVVNARVKQGDRYVDGDPTFYPIVIWGVLGENAAESLSRGDRVIVTGTWQQKPYKNDKDEIVRPWELNVEAIGPDLRYTATRKKQLDRQSRGDAPTGGSADDPWATATPR